MVSTAVLGTPKLAPPVTLPRLRLTVLSPSTSGLRSTGTDTVALVWPLVKVTVVETSE